jgi:acyl-ACP thioesterase
MCAVRDELTEIVAPTGRGRAFEVTVRGGLADVTPSGRVRLDAVAGWLQDVARADLDDALDGADWLWVVRRTRIQVERFPRYGESCTARTWCSGTGSMWAERRTTVTGRSARLEAAALWVRVDEERGRPVPPSARCAELYAASAGERRVKARLRHPGPPREARRSTWRFRAAELDLAGHINNAAYWTVLEEELADGPEPQAFDAEIEFRAGAQPGDAVVLHDGARRWILDCDAEVSASVLIATA